MALALMIPKEFNLIALIIRSVETMDYIINILKISSNCIIFAGLLFMIISVFMAVFKGEAKDIMGIIKEIRLYCIIMAMIIAGIAGRSIL